MLSMRGLSLLSLAVACSAAKPNIIFFLTDDQDQLLGGSMPKVGDATPIGRTQKLLGEGGVLADNMYIHTPICCPSRSETFTGRYLHNIKEVGQCPEGYEGHDDAGNDCCMHVDEELVNNATMARELSGAGYKVGMFGKYLNVCPKTPPPGFDAWLANGGGNYFSPQFSVAGITGLANGSHTFSADNYTTSVVGNYSHQWIKEVAPKGPFVAFINPKACHEPFTPAKWYADTWEEGWPATAPRPPSFNMTKEERANHHPGIAAMDMLSNTTVQCIDETYKNRWRTLISVDDLIVDTVQLVQDLGIMDNTYFIYSSDHGYQLGEMNLAMDKRNVYEYDIKIHMAIRGPGITPGSTFSEPATNVDIAPTILELAGITDAPVVDGRSLVPFFMKGDEYKERREAGWRTSTYHEYYYVGIGVKCSQAQPIETPDDNFIAVRHQTGSKFGNILYSEFTTDTDGFTDFSDIHFYEMYNMDTDPWQLKNIYAEQTNDTKAALHADVHQWLKCKGADCQ